MRKLNPKAWGLLTTDEQTALSIQFGMGKSSWQAGEMMDKSHYKYLEIKYRAEHLLKLFTEYAQLYDKVIPEVNGDKMVIEYLTRCIMKRRKPMKVIDDMAEDGLRVTKGKINILLSDQFNKWEKSTDAHERVMYDLIKEYDRWNNFRILPKTLQEPSAYKRRVKNVYKKHLKIVTALHPLSLTKLLKLYKTNKRPFLYMPIVHDGESVIYKMKVNKQSRQIMSSTGLYLFSTSVLAQEYLEAIEGYVGKNKKQCIDGLTFWPKYRELIKKADNYQDIQQITPNRKYLPMAMAQLEYL
jgi:tRNA A37 threonylcarbamoyladenosine synthetase subunit TsaC/SUA5/YrdC